MKTAILLAMILGGGAFGCGGSHGKLRADTPVLAYQKPDISEITGIDEDEATEKEEAPAPAPAAKPAEAKPAETKPAETKPAATPAKTPPAPAQKTPPAAPAPKPAK